MDVFMLQHDGSQRLLATGLDWGEVIEIEEQCRYTKPFGSDIKIVVRTDIQAILGFRTTGTEPGAAGEMRHPENFIG